MFYSDEPVVQLAREIIEISEELLTMALDLTRLIF